MSRRYQVHHVYNKYAADKEGQILCINIMKTSTGNSTEFILRDADKPPRTTTKALFIWECFNGPIEGRGRIKHINGDIFDNRLENLIYLVPMAKKKVKESKKINLDGGKKSLTARFAIKS